MKISIDINEELAFYSVFAATLLPIVLVLLTIVLYAYIRGLKKRGWFYLFPILAGIASLLSIGYSIIFFSGF